MYVYVIDANPDCREMLTLPFKWDGDRVCAFPTFDEAGLALQMEEAPDLAIAEVRVPGELTLADFGSRLKQFNPFARLIVYSASRPPNLAELNADMFVSRPNELDSAVSAARKFRFEIRVRPWRLADETRRLQEGTARLIVHCNQTRASFLAAVDDARETRARCQQASDAE